MLGRDQRLQQIEGSEVRRKVAVRMSDHRRTTAQHHVAGDQPADSVRAEDQQRARVAGVTGRLDHLERYRAER